MFYKLWTNCPGSGPNSRENRTLDSITQTVKAARNAMTVQIGPSKVGGQFELVSGLSVTEFCTPLVSPDSDTGLSRSDIPVEPSSASTVNPGRLFESQKQGPGSDTVKLLLQDGSD